MLFVAREFKTTDIGLFGVWEKSCINLDVIFFGSFKCHVEQTVIPGSVGFVHVRLEHADAGGFHPIFLQPEKPCINVSLSLPGLDKNLGTKNGHVRHCFLRLNC
jgi:hypothetical protein